MENNLHHLLEKDAAPISSQNLEIVEYSNESGALESINRTVNNSMVLSNQTNSSSVIKFDNCKNITLGSVFNVGWLPGTGGIVAEPNISNVARSKEALYRKTPTIKQMLESTDLISSAFLDIVAGNFGAKWKDVTILLQINQLFVERMYEDYNDRGGTKEVKNLRFNWNFKAMKFISHIFLGRFSSSLKIFQRSRRKIHGWLVNHVSLAERF